MKMIAIRYQCDKSKHRNTQILITQIENTQIVITQIENTQMYYNLENLIHKCIITYIENSNES